MDCSVVQKAAKELASICGSYKAVSKECGVARSNLNRIANGAYGEHMTLTTAGKISRAWERKTGKGIVLAEVRR